MPDKVVNGSITSAIKQGCSQLRWTGSIDSPGLEVELLFAHSMGTSRAYLMAHGEQKISPKQRAAFNALLERRQLGIPMAYLLGSREFWSLDLVVDDQVLIPRPDTEILVERALHRCTGQGMSIADLGTGSGAIALAIASERPGCRIVAVEKFQEAIKIAKSNVARIGLGNIEILRSNWFSGLAGRRFNIIASNPPYIDPTDVHLLGEVRFEPREALVSGHNGLADLITIINGAPNHLESGGWLLVEHGHAQARGVTALMLSAGFRLVQTYRDLAGNERVTEGQVSSRDPVSN